MCQPFALHGGAPRSPSSGAPRLGPGADLERRTDIMSMDPQNPQYSNPGPLFPGAANYGDSGAPGTQGVMPGAEGGPVVGSPPVTIVYQSVQAQPPQHV